MTLLDRLYELYADKPLPSLASAPVDWRWLDVWRDEEARAAA